MLVNFMVRKGQNSQRSPRKQFKAEPFSFGPRRYVSRGPRRLFRLQEGPLSPVYDPGTERPKAILRIQLDGTTL